MSGREVVGRSRDAVHGTITAVLPTYNVAAYLPDCLASIDAQTGKLDHVEFVFVDDGSPDASSEIIGRWMADRPKLNVRLVRKANGGLSSARNAGLDVATGEWVTFPDPDDVFDPAYWGEMVKFVTSPEADTVHVIAGRFIFLNDDTGKRSDTHGLRFRFTDGNRIVDLDQRPQFIHVAANTGLFRRDVLTRFGLRFDGAVQPVWEDGHLTARYLSKFERPRIAMMATAKYYYRRRSDGSSLMDGQWTRRGKFVDVPKGWLDALRIAADEHDGRVPLWIQNMVLYDVMGYFKQERRSPSPTATLPREYSDRFFDILGECMCYIDLDALDGFRVNHVDVEIRIALRMTYKQVGARPGEVFLDKIDKARDLVRVRWYYVGPAPAEQFHARGFVVEPVFAKTRPATFYGRTLLHERIVWLPANATLAIRLDGAPMVLRTGPVQVRRLQIGPTAIWRELVGAAAERRPEPRYPGLRPALGRVKRRVQRTITERRDPAERERAAAQRLVRLSRTPFYRHRYKDAWLLTDRDSQANDNAEHLYRWLRANRRRVNCWFVLSRQSPDWDRLEREGFRLLEHMSREHVLALLNCRHLISSQIDWYITRPLPRALYGAENVDTWTFTFLQHGVTKDDLSIWINPKPIDLMITATPDEQQSIVSNASPYVWSDREIRLTGFPRHDRLLALGRGAAGRDPRLILVMPTWRRSLVLDQVAGGNDRAPRADFWQTDYAQQWRRVLESDKLHELVADHGYEFAFVPHPNMQTYLDNSPLPRNVQVHKFADIDIQELLARAAVLVTDYSSMAFEMAYLERPVVYFQFDQADFFNGGHAYRRGSWSYEADGFGPVTVDADDAVAAIAQIVRRDGRAEPSYAERMARTFPYRDGECARRTYDAIVDITRPLTYSQLFRRPEAPRPPEPRPVVEELNAKTRP